LGLGVEGYVENHLIHVGNERFMKEKGVACVAAHKDRSRLEEGGFSCLHIAVDGVLSGLIPYADQIRTESKAIIDKLRELGVVNTIMLTGDNAIVAQAVSAQLGLTQYYSELMPNDKSDIIQKLQKEGHVVAMVGDGINDSPALSYADVGIAMKHGADVVHESADVILMEDSLEKFVHAIEISKQSISLIKQNYGIVAGLNTIALILAVPGGLVSPAITALVSNGSTLLASANGIRPIFSRPKRK
jgi:Cu2+-exporting ATPase